MQNISVIWVKDGSFTVIDADMCDELSKFQWKKDRNGYVLWEEFVRKGKNRRHWMHQIVNKTPDNFITDHVNLVTWDNRRVNLRTATHHQNHQNTRKRKGRNTSVFKGVSFVPKTGRWRARAFVNGREIAVYCATEGEAALVYNALAQQHFGEFARLNDVNPEFLVKRGGALPAEN